MQVTVKHSKKMFCQTNEVPWSNQSSWPNIGNLPLQCQAVPKGGAPARERSLPPPEDLLWDVEIICLPQSLLTFVTNPGERFTNVCGDLAVNSYIHRACRVHS